MGRSVLGVPSLSLAFAKRWETAKRDRCRRHCGRARDALRAGPVLNW
jgi:hypothetical protein